MKMDRRLLSKQYWELRYIAWRCGVTVQEAREFQARFGPSRKRVIEAILAVQQ